MTVTKEIEIEAKNLVTEQQFHLICEQFSLTASDFKTQVNYYFDTKDYSLKKKRTALRIRKKDNSFELTLKQPNEVGLLETNEPLSEEEAKLMIHEQILPNGEVNKIIQSLINNERLYLIGELVTERAEIAYKNGTLVFDKSTYLNKTDYELEFEGEDEEEVENIFSELLQKYNIERLPAKNKIARLFDYQKEIGN